MKKSRANKIDTGFAYLSSSSSNAMPSGQNQDKVKIRPSAFMKPFTHINARGDASMVDVSAKPALSRQAIASGEIRLQKKTYRRIRNHSIAKGNVLATARIAGILAAKKTGDLIPLCHPLPITHCEVDFEFPASGDRILIQASAKITAQTGVEMEALTAVTVAALTIYDMCKAVDKKMRITNVRLISKTKKEV
jgi:cyclic pyranopterin phosphate synthase